MGHSKKKSKPILDLMGESLPSLDVFLAPHPTSTPDKPVSWLSKIDSGDIPNGSGPSAVRQLCDYVPLAAGLIEFQPDSIQNCHSNDALMDHNG